MKLRNILAGAGVVAALAFASAASAGTYDLGNLSTTAPLSISVSDTGTSVNDTFNFSIVPPPLTTYGQLVNYFVQNQAGKTISDVFSSGTISLYNSANTLLDQVSILGAPGIGATTVTDTTNLNVGDYHFVVDGTVYNNGPVNYTFGIFGAAVPEPASWAMMILGVGLIGASLRRRQGVATLA